jgi:phosphate transport system substrate-binding protein
MKLPIYGAFVLLSVVCFAGCLNDTSNLDEGLNGATTVEETGSGSETQAVSQLQGSVVADGSSTVYPITEAVAGEFKKKFPKVNVTVAKSGTGGGFKRFVIGDTDISDASRPITPEEFAKCQEGTIDFVELPVAYDGLTVVVHPENDWVKELTIADLQKIYLAADDQPQKWSDVNPAWPATELKIYSPGTDSGTFDYFKEVLVGKDKEKSMRADMQTSEEDNVLVTGVAGDKGAIGFFGCAYYFENSKKLRAIPIVNDAGKAVMPSPEVIESGEYNPLSRPLFIYVSAKALRRPEVKQFVDFYMANAADLSGQVGYVSLPTAIYAQAGECLKNRQLGTHFHTADGEKREGSLSEIYQPGNLVKVK